MNPKVTIGMPTYNRAVYLKDSIPLVLKQSFKDFEFIICDDCSSDNTTEVVQSFSDPRIRYYRNEKNLKIPGNLNRILELANGEYIVFLHDHDIFDPKLIEKMYNLLEKNPDVGFIHPGVAWINNDGNNREDLIMDFPEILDGRKMLDKILLSDSFSSPICACGLVRRSVMNEVGYYYDPAFGFVSDVDLWFRLLLKFKVGYINEPVLTCRNRDESHEFYNVNWNMHKWLVEIFRINIERRFKSDKEDYQRALRIWKKKRKNVHRNSMFKTLVDADYSSFKEGLKFSDNLVGKASSFIFSRPVFKLTAGFFYTFNKLRKKII